MRAPWSPPKAIQWLRDERKRGSHEWRGMCAGLAAHAASYGGAGRNANEWAWAIPHSIRRTGTPPAGALVFWPGFQYGHVSWSLGGGWLLCNKPDGSVGRMRVEYYSGSPRFWVDPRKNQSAIFGACFGENTDKVVVTVPNPAVARPGTRSAAVPAIRKALGGKSQSTYYGGVLKRRVVRWQKAHHQPATGIVTKSQMAAMRAHK